MLGRKILIVLFFIPFSLFVGTTALVTIQGINVYQRIVTDINGLFNIETPLAYINTKIKKLDGTQSIQIINQEGTQVLVLAQDIEGDIYETWIYAHKGKLCETLMLKGMTFELSEGIAVTEVEDLSMKLLTSNLLEVTLLTAEGIKYTRIVAIRSNSIR